MENLTAGNVKSAMKSAGAISADLWQVPPEKLKILPGFNIRTKNARYEERVQWITESILANGYLKSAPLAGYVARENGEDVVYVTGGHRRHEAIQRVLAAGVDLPTVPVIVSPKGTSMEDL